jgi:hypothetical protein
MVRGERMTPVAFARPAIEFEHVHPGNSDIYNVINFMSPTSANPPTTLPGCTNAQLLSAIGMEDAGTLNVLNAVFQPALRALVQRLTGDQCDFNATMANLPPFGTGSNTGTAECLHRCGIAAPKIRIT